MKDFNLRKYLAKNRLLKEEIDFPELEDEFEGYQDAMLGSDEEYLQGVIDATPEELLDLNGGYYEVALGVEQGRYSAEEAVKLAKAWAISKLGDYNETEDFYKYGDYIVQKYDDGEKPYAVFKDRGEKTDSYGSPDFEFSDPKDVEAFLTKNKLVKETTDDSYYIDEIKRDLEELDDKEANKYLEDLAKSILKLKR